MHKSTLAHFLIVGVAFAFLGGWILTIVVNSILAVWLHSAFGGPPTSRYLGSLIFTLTSISLIALATFAGNRVFVNRRLSDLPPSLLVSTLLYAVIVLVLVTPELAGVFSRITSNTSYYYRNTGEATLELSLPFARLLLLPLCYFVIARYVLTPRGT